VPGASVNYDVVLLELVKLSGDLRLEEKQEGLCHKADTCSRDGANPNKGQLLDHNSERSSKLFNSTA